MPGEGENFVKFAEGAKDNSLAEMVRGLLTQNFDRAPQKVNVAKGLKGFMYIEAVDINMGITLEFAGADGIVIHSGKAGKPKIEVYADSITIIDMSRISFKGPLPNFFDEVGRSILKKMLSGQLKVKGMILHPLFVMKVLNVFSVM